MSQKRILNDKISARSSKSLSSFRRREDGSMMVLGLLIFFVILMVSGLAVDYMRYESTRMRVQATADRASLAAATLREVGDREAIVREYFEVAGLTRFLVDVELGEPALNASRVTIRTNPSVNTMFMRWVGVNELVSLELSEAREEVSNIEISLVLDISGSMRWVDSTGMPRMTRLRSAAKNFVASVLDTDIPDTTSITIVPYAGLVNPGQTAFNALGGTAWHAYSHCPDLPSSTFSSTGLPNAAVMPQAPHFMNWATDVAWLDWGWCPNESNSIRYHSGNVEELQSFIDDLRLHDGTGTHYAMRWGLALLDPESQWLTGTLVAQDMVDPAFSNRPSEWDDPETIKVIVLMTDGHITDQFRPKRTSSSHVFGTNGIFPTEAEQDTLNTSHINGLHSSWRQRITTVNQNLSNFYVACDFAKANRIIVYTIAFETNVSGQNEMRNCATTSSHFFNANGLELEVAFSAIAASIQTLRLMQ